MTDKISPYKRSENMRKIPSKDMKPEIIVRQLVHSLGYRYQLHKKELPGKPDLVFASRKKIIFVNGCFWHQHEDPKCPIARMPKSNLTFWITKLKRTKNRDFQHIEKLQNIGWKTLIIWECTLKDRNKVQKMIAVFLN